MWTSGELAGKVRRFVDASRPVVRRNLRIRAKWSCAIDGPVRHVRGDNLFGRSLLLDPLLERGNRIEHVWPLTAAAVAHSWRHEQAVRVRELHRTPQQRVDLLVILHAVSR